MIWFEFKLRHIKMLFTLISVIMMYMIDRKVIHMSCYWFRMFSLLIICRVKLERKGVACLILGTF